MIKIWLQEQASNPKLGAIVAAGTTSSGAFSLLGWIPQDIIKFSVLIGVILSSTMIIVTVAKEARDRQKHRLEVQKLEIELTKLRNELKTE